MACACRVAQDLSRLQNTLGVKTEKKNKKRIDDYLKAFFIWLIVIAVFPIMLLYVIFRPKKKDRVINFRFIKKLNKKTR